MGEDERVCYRDNHRHKADNWTQGTVFCFYWLPNLAAKMVAVGTHTHKKPHFATREMEIKQVLTFYLSARTKE